MYTNKLPGTKTNAAESVIKRLTLTFSGLGTEVDYLSHYLSQLEKKHKADLWCRMNISLGKQTHWHSCSQTVKLRMTRYHQNGMKQQTLVAQMLHTGHVLISWGVLGLLMYWNLTVAALYIPIYLSDKVKKKICRCRVGQKKLNQVKLFMKTIAHSFLKLLPKENHNHKEILLLYSFYCNRLERLPEATSVNTGEVFYNEKT